MSLKEGILRPLMPVLLKQFPSINQALKYTREVLNIPIRTKTFYDLAREVLNIERARTPWESLRSEYRFDESKIPEVSYSMRGNYRYLIEYEAETAPGTWEKKFVSFYSSRNLTKYEIYQNVGALLGPGEWERITGKMKEENPSWTAYRIKSVTVVKRKR
jgi:hypothetical protein